MNNGAYCGVYCCCSEVNVRRKSTMAGRMWDIARADVVNTGKSMSIFIIVAIVFGCSMVLQIMLTGASKADKS